MQWAVKKLSQSPEPEQGSGSCESTTSNNSSSSRNDNNHHNHNHPHPSPNSNARARPQSAKTQRERPANQPCSLSFRGRRERGRGGFGMVGRARKEDSLWLPLTINTTVERMCIARAEEHTVAPRPPHPCCDERQRERARKGICKTISTLHLGWSQTNNRNETWTQTD